MDLLHLGKDWLLPKLPDVGYSSSKGLRLVSNIEMTDLGAYYQPLCIYVKTTRRAAIIIVAVQVHHLAAKVCLHIGRISAVFIVLQIINPKRHLADLAPRIVATRPRLPIQKGLAATSIWPFIFDELSKVGTQKLVVAYDIEFIKQEFCSPGSILHMNNSKDRLVCNILLSRD